jgi:hypothetical protein
MAERAAQYKDLRSPFHPQLSMVEKNADSAPEAVEIDEL